MKRFWLVFCSLWFVVSLCGAQLQGTTNPQPEPFAYTYNFWRGGARLREGLMRVRYQFGGIDIVRIGDSRNTFGDNYSAEVNFERNLMQERFNPPGVTGGYGFMPFEIESAATGNWTFVNGSSTWSKSHNSDPNFGVGCFEAKIGSAGIAATNKIWRTFDPTAANGVLNRQGVERFELVGVSYTGVCHAVYCDHSTTPGAMAVSTLVNGSEAGNWGSHYTVQTGLNPAVSNTIQFANHEVTDQCWIDGCNLYNGDWTDGVRYANLASVGATTDRFLAGSNGDATEDAMLAANIDEYSTGSHAGGMRNMKLLQIQLGPNDNGYSSSPMTVAHYKANLQKLITRAVARPSRPCVELIWDVDANNMDAARLLTYPQFRDACRQLCDENKDTVFMVDHWKSARDATHPEGYAPYGVAPGVAGGYMFDRDFYNDGVHGSALFNYQRAQQNFAVLSYGIG